MPPRSATVKPVALPVSLPNFYSFGHISGRQVAETLADPLDRLHDRLAAVGVGKAQIALAELTEAGAGYCRDPRLVEQLALQGAGLQTGLRHLGQSADRPARPRTATHGQAVH